MTSHMPARFLRKRIESTIGMAVHIQSKKKPTQTKMALNVESATVSAVLWAVSPMKRIGIIPMLIGTELHGMN